MYLEVYNMNKIVVVLERNNVYSVAFLNEDMTQLLQPTVLTEAQLLQASKCNECLNFSIQNGKVVQDSGVFSRLDHNGTSMIVLKVLCTNSGRVVGYSCLNTKSFAIGNVKREQLLEQQKKQGDLPLLQNGIIRNDTVNAYPGKVFPKQVVGVQGRAARPQKPTKVAPSEKPAKKHIPEFIANPNLSNAQRKLLLDGKRAGALVEYYNNPNIKPECMDLYNNLIVDKNVAEDCKPIFENTDLNAEQAYELYRCALLGVDYSDLNDASLTKSELELGRLNKSMDLWGDVDYAEEPDAELFEKCLRMKENTYKN